MGYSQFVELSPSCKTRKCAEANSSKGRTWDTTCWGGSRGGPCLNWLAAGQAGDETKMVKPRDHWWGRFCCRHAWRPSRSAGVTSPCARSFPSAIPFRSVRAKRETSIEALIFHQLIHTQVRREGKARDSKVKSQRLHRPSGKINFWLSQYPSRRDWVRAPKPHSPHFLSRPKTTQFRSLLWKQPAIARIADLTRPTHFLKVSSDLDYKNRGIQWHDSIKHHYFGPWLSIQG